MSLTSSAASCRSGQALVAVEPQVFDLLVYLLRHRDRVVSKDDLIAGVWGGRIVSEATVSSRINAARRAVGDSGEQQSLIRTIPRKGIRFVAQVDELSGQGVTAASAAAPPGLRQQIYFCTAADGVRLAYAVSGEGSPLVMSATWLTHLEHQWRSLAWRPWLDAFTREHKLLRYDSRGCGLSDRDAGDLSFETWVRDFECIIEAAALPRFALVATCQGGPIAIEYAARHPERVSRLILYGTYARGRIALGRICRRRSTRRGCCSISPASAGARRTTRSCRYGPRIFSRAAHSTICGPGATSSAQQLPPRPPYV